MRVPAPLRRRGALFTAPSLGRRTVFVHSDGPGYELYFDGKEQSVFEYNGIDGRRVQALLTRDQDREFMRRGPASVADLCRRTVAGQAPAEALVFRTA